MERAVVTIHNDWLGSQQIVIDVFRGFRDELLGTFGKIDYSRKADNSQVTELDVRIETTLKQSLFERYPDFGFQGEETGTSGSRGTYWLVDPIDGTSSFIRGLPFCTNMAALIHNGTTVLSVIYDFVNDKLYTAQKDNGSFCDGEPISINKDRESGDFVLYSLTRRNLPLLSEAMEAIGARIFLPIGAAGYDYIQVASGTIDGLAILFSLSGAHDNAPGLLLCEEAGAEVFMYDEGQQGIDRHEFIVGSPKLIEAIEHSGLLA